MAEYIITYLCNDRMSFLLSIVMLDPGNRFSLARKAQWIQESGYIYLAMLPDAIYLSMYAIRVPPINVLIEDRSCLPAEFLGSVFSPLVFTGYPPRHRTIWLRKAEEHLNLVGKDVRMRARQQVSRQTMRWSSTSMFTLGACHLLY